jgi:hypothetical protein
MDINIRQLQADLRDLEDKIREVKKQLRTTWTRPMDSQQYALLNLKADATERYVLRAYARGRFHLKDHERCKDIAERAAKKYALAA